MSHELTYINCFTCSACVFLIHIWFLTSSVYFSHMEHLDFFFTWFQKMIMKGKMFWKVNFAHGTWLYFPCDFSHNRFIFTHMALGFISQKRCTDMNHSFSLMIMHVFEFTPPHMVKKKNLISSSKKKLCFFLLPFL